MKNQWENRFYVYTEVLNLVSTKYQYYIIGPWDRIDQSHGLHKYQGILNDIIEAWGICDDLNRLLRDLNA